MQLPIISNAGSGAKNLVQQQLEIFKAAKNLLETLNKNFPHQRDYLFVRGSYQNAYSEAQEKINQVQKIMEDCQEMAMQIQKMIGE